MVLACLSILVNAQESNPQELNKKPKLDHIQISVGGELSTAPLLMSREDFSKLAPDANLYPFDPMEDFHSRMMYSWNANNFNIQLGWSPNNKESKEKSTHRAWRIGLTTQSFQSNLYSSVKENTYRVDTLYQASNGSIYGFIDSTERFISNGYYQATMIKVDVSQIWSTGLDKRFNLYTGLGINTGLNLSPRTEIVNSRRSISEVVDANGQMISSNGTFNSNDDFQREIYRNKIGWSAAAYIPLGLDFRVGQKREYLKNLHFFSEFRPSLHFVNVPETRGYLFPTFQSTVGLKWNW